MLMVFPVIIQSPDSFLCCFWLSPLSSLNMMMLSLLDVCCRLLCRCISISFEFHLPLFFSFGVQTRLPFLATFLMGRTTDIGFSNILHAPFLTPSIVNILVLDVCHNEVDMPRDRVRTP